MPKQFLKLFEEKSLFQLTIERNKECSSHLLVSNSEQYFLAIDQIEELKNKSKYNYILEPSPRNTAPAIALACLNLDPETIVLVTPSDHLIKNTNEYNNVVNKAKKLAEENYLVTFGIIPTAPETGFGYIEYKNNDVLSFKEKPNKETATEYLNNGNYLWNSGMFCFKAGVFLSELEKYSPEIYNQTKIAFDNSKNDKNMLRINYEDMENIPENSIDYAVMEQSKIVKVVEADIGWNDIGSFDAIYDELEKNENNNAILSNHISIDSKNNLIIGNERLITTIGVDNLIIIDTGDALLVIPKGQSQRVKEAVEELKKRNTNLQNIHLTAHRPWGNYTILEDNEKYKIKRIIVKPGKELSLQKHYHRSEHWIVVSGTALVQVGEKKETVRQNESIYIPMTEVHRLTNNGLIDLVLIEAQVGEYLGEDDIVRLEDNYGRI